jgi:Tfp pilus assembly protein PilN
MIKINLLPQKRAKKIVQVGREPGSRDLVIGVASLAAAAVLVFLVFDMPKRSKLRDLHDQIDRWNSEIAAKKKQLKGFEEMKQAEALANARVEAINRLNQAKVVPANVLHELGEIMTPNQGPTMTEEMAKKTGNGPESDPNKRFDLAWDPQKVWITSFVDNGGNFRLEGAAQAQVDIIQLSKRLQASAYFDAVSQQHEERVSDRETGITFFTFVITGKVLY